MRGRQPNPIRPFRSFPGQLRSWARSPRSAGPPTRSLEYAGEALKIGDRVVMCPDILCGKCWYCRNTFGFPLCQNIKGYGNAFTCDEVPHRRAAGPTISMSARTPSCSRPPEDIELRIAVMAELMTCTYNLDKAKELYTMGGEGFGSGATIVIQGVGPLGLLHVLKARLMGAGTIIAIDRSDFRLQLARDFGADAVISLNGTTQAERVQAVRDLTQGPRRRHHRRMHRGRRGDPQGAGNGAARRRLFRRGRVRRCRRHPHQSAPAFAGQPDPPLRHDQPSPDRLPEQPASFEQIQEKPIRWKNS